MDIIKNRKHDIYKYKFNKNGKINCYSNNYNQEIGIKGVIIKHYNFDYIKFPPNLIKKNNSSKNISEHNFNLLLLYSYFIKNKNLYYINNDNKKGYKFIFLKNNMDNIIKYLYIKTKIYENKKIFISNDYDLNNDITKLIFGYIYILLLHNKKYTSNNEIYIKLYYQYYLDIISTEIYLLYNKKYSDFANYRELYMFLKKRGYINTFYKKIIPIIKKNYKKVLNNIDFSGIKVFEKKIYKEMKPFSKININKIIDEYYPNKNRNKIIKDKLKELMKKINV